MTPEKVVERPTSLWEWRNRR